MIRSLGHRIFQLCLEQAGAVAHALVGLRVEVVVVHSLGRSAISHANGQAHFATLRANRRNDVGCFALDRVVVYNGSLCRCGMLPGGEAHIDHARRRTEPRPVYLHGLVAGDGAERRSHGRDRVRRADDGAHLSCLFETTPTRIVEEASIFQLTYLPS